MLRVDLNIEGVRYRGPEDELNPENFRYTLRFQNFNIS